MGEMKNDKLAYLLKIVVENYVEKWEPVGSKFLHTLDVLDFAPSTLRKYLNILEKEGLVYQSYSNSGRIPTIEGMSKYLDEIINQDNQKSYELDINQTRISLKYIVEQISSITDGAVVWLLENDEYYYLGINNLLKDVIDPDEYNITREIIKLIEQKEIIWFLNKRVVKKNQVYYTFIWEDSSVISCLYCKVDINGFDAVIAILGSMRVDYEKNCRILQTVLRMIWV